MSKKRGLSLEEKRQRMVEIFYEKKEFFQLKELEKIAPKAKGIIAQSVKDVVQSLVDDGLVDSEKIGTSIYFWAFPSKASNQRKRKLTELEERLSELKKLRTTAEDTLTSAKAGREEGDDRERLLQELREATLKNEELKEKIQEFRDLDPDALEEMKRDAEVAKDAANRWTDNIFAVKSWCKSKFSMEEQVINKQFGIPEELDYI